MKVTKVCCQGCGADLQVDDTVRYVTCNYCHTRLEVVHDETVTHTRLLDKIERTTDRMAGNLKVIELQNDLERLDREWQNQRSGLMVRNKNGHVSEPSSAASVAGGFIAIGVGIVWIIFTSSMHAPAFFPLFGLVIMGMAVFGMVSGTNKAGAYRTGQARYENERARLIEKLENEREK
jgi:hypothetical protein